MRILHLHRTELDYSDLWGSPEHTGLNFQQRKCNRSFGNFGQKESIIETKPCSELNFWENQ